MYHFQDVSIRVVAMPAGWQAGRQAGWLAGWRTLLLKSIPSLRGRVPTKQSILKKEIWIWVSGM